MHDDSFVGGRTLAAGLFEGDWRLKKGHNLKFTAEYEDPDRHVPQDQFTRYSLLYVPAHPIPCWLRAGFISPDVPQSPAENQRLILAELHGYF